MDMIKRGLLVGATLGALTLSSFAGMASAEKVDKEQFKDYDIHTVQKGDTLWTISGEWHCDFKEMVELNKQFANPDLIHPEDEVVIPMNRVEGIEKVFLPH